MGGTKSEASENQGLKNASFDARPFFLRYLFMFDTGKTHTRVGEKYSAGK